MNLKLFLKMPPHIKYDENTLTLVTAHDSQVNFDYLSHLREWNLIFSTTKKWF